MIRCIKRMRIIPYVLLIAGLAAAQAPCPKCLLDEAEKALPESGPASATIAKLKTAVAQFEITAKDDPAHAEALEMLAMYLHWAYKSNLDMWKAELGPGVEEALAICEGQPGIDPETLALALELHADMLGRTGAGLPFWARAEKIRAARIAAVQPEEKQAPGVPVKIHGDVVAPRLKTKVEPQFPALARHAGMECSGDLIGMVIDSNGIPGQFQLLRGCGYGFDETALNAVRQWRFVPSSLSGSPVAIVSQAEVNFVLQGSGVDSQNSAETTKQAGEVSKKGREALGRHDYEEAEKDFGEATKLNPKDNYAWNNLGMAELGLRQVDKAERAFKRQIEVNAMDAYAYNNLGRAFALEGRLPEAVEEYRKQIEIAPDDRYAHLNLAKALNAQGKWGEAIPEAQKAAAITPTNGACLFELGKAQAHLGNLEEAKKTFNKTLDTNDSTTAQNSVAYAMAESGIDLGRAWQLASSVITVDSGQVCNPDQAVGGEHCTEKLAHLAGALDTAGWVLFKQGKPDEAKPFLESAYGIAPHAEIALHLAALYGKQKKTDAAVRMYGIAQLSPALDLAENNAAKTELQEALGGPVRARLEALPKQELAEGHVSVPEGWHVDGITTPATLSVWVDGGGNILQVKPQGNTALTPAQISQVQALKLLPLAWPEHALKSVRTLEIRAAGTVYSIVSYVEAPIGKSAPGEALSAEAVH